jgi:transposase
MGKATSTKKFNLKTPQKAKVDLSNRRKLPNLTQTQREMIHLMHNGGSKPSEIAARIGCSKRTVSRTLQNIKNTNSYAEKPRSGRPKVCSERVVKRIVTISSNNRRLGSFEISHIIEEKYGQKVNPRTVRDILFKHGLKGRPAPKKTLLSNRNVKKRFAWGKEHAPWTVQQWKKVCWTDESGFKVFGSNRRQIVRRLDKEELRADTIHQTVKGGGGTVMVWGCFAGNKLGKLHRIKGIMDQHVYHTVMQTQLVPSIKSLFPNGDFVYMQDNDPKHTSHYCTNYLRTLADRHHFQIMNWPAQSPDLNPIELLWDHMKREVSKRHPTSEDHLWEICQDVWNNIKPEVLDKLINRMPFICKMVLKQRGGYFQEKGVRKRCKDLGLVTEPELLEMFQK